MITVVNFKITPFQWVSLNKILGAVEYETGNIHVSITLPYFHKITKRNVLVSSTNMELCLYMFHLFFHYLSYYEIACESMIKFVWTVGGDVLKCLMFNQQIFERLIIVDVDYRGKNDRA